MMRFKNLIRAHLSGIFLFGLIAAGVSSQFPNILLALTFLFAVFMSCLSYRGLLEEFTAFFTTG